MRASRLLLLLLLAAAMSLFVACAEDPANPGPGDDGSSLGTEDYGTLSLTLTADELQELLPNLSVRLTIVPNGQTTPVYSHTEDFAQSLWVTEVRLPPGTYNLSAEVFDLETGEVWYSGAESGVAVVPWEMTAVTMTLQASGGVSVLVDLGLGGMSFTKEPAPPQQTIGANWPGVVRRHTSSGDQYLYFDVRKLRVFAAANDVVNYSLATPIATYDDVYWGIESKPSLAVAGEDLFLAGTGGELSVYDYYSGQVFIKRFNWSSGLFEPWGSLAYERTPDPLTGFLPSLRSCALQIDEAFHLVCAVAATNGTAKTVGLVSASSIDGIAWTPMLPYLPNGEIDFLVTSPTQYSTTSIIRGAALVRVGGIYRAYFLNDEGSKSVVLMSSSADFLHWTPLVNVFELDVGNATLFGVVPTATRWELFYRVSAKVLLATSP